MKRKQIQILLILSAVAAALAILLAVLSREPAVPETRLLLQSSAPLSTICYTNKDGTVRLEQENGVWRLSGDSCFAAGCADACAGAADRADRAGNHAGRGCVRAVWPGAAAVRD